jgi:xanthine dehydrogenase small subunit
MRDFVEFDINGQYHRVQGAEAFLTLADFLRYRLGLTGTKIVCAEGDCGACTVLARSIRCTDDRFESLNSCIRFVWQLDGHQILTVEGLKRNDRLHPAQQAMVECHAAQCGYCTPGFVCSLAQLMEDSRSELFTIDRKRAQNYLTGNLCRCTGYEPILEAAMSMASSEVESLVDFYPVDDRKWQSPDSVLVNYQNKTAFLPTTLDEARSFCSHHPQVIGGATDLGVLQNKGKWTPLVQMSLQAVAELGHVQRYEERYLIGANVTLSELSKSLGSEFSEFSRMLRIFASSQIKNAATLVGNLMNASPIADTIPFLKVADAKVHLMSPQSYRIVDINSFFLPGYKQLDRRPDELVTHIEIPIRNWEFRLYKVSRRKDLDISAVTAAFAYRLEQGRFSRFAVAFGGVGPSVIRFSDLEGELIGQSPRRELFQELFEKIDPFVKPLTDVRGSAHYRRTLVRNLLLKFFDEVSNVEVHA